MTETPVLPVNCIGGRPGPSVAPENCARVITEDSSRTGWTGCTGVQTGEVPGNRD